MSIHIFIVFNEYNIIYEYYLRKNYIENFIIFTQ
jgi:hypothetical protein